MSISETRVRIVDTPHTPVRFSYFYGHEPYVGTDKITGKVTRSFCSHFLMAPTHPAIPLISAAIVAAAKAFFGDKWEVMLESFKAKSKIPLRKGEIHKPGEDAYKGMYSLAGNSKNRFTIVETREGKNVPLTGQDGRPYSGAFGNAIVNFYGYNKGGGIGIGCGIEGVQFTRHGEAFGGGRVASVDEFGLVDVSGADMPAPAIETASVENLLGL